MVLTGLLASASAWAAPAEDGKALEKKIIGILNGKGPQMDRCVERYLAEYPTADGTLTLTMKVGKAGAVVEASADTKLPGARNLRPCVAGVAKGYEFPAPSKEEGVTLTLSLVVKKGAKFKLYAPGEAPPKPKEGEPEPLFKFLPQGWTPQP